MALGKQRQQRRERGDNQRGDNQRGGAQRGDNQRGGARLSRACVLGRRRPGAYHIGAGIGQWLHL